MDDLIEIDDPPMTPEEEEAAIRWLEAHPEFVADVRQRYVESFSRSTPFVDVFRKLRDSRHKAEVKK